MPDTTDSLTKRVSRSDSPKRKAAKAAVATLALGGLVLLAAAPAHFAPSTSTVSTAKLRVDLRPPLQDRLARAIQARYQISIAAASRYAAAMVETAEFHDEDPVVYAAIAGVESSFKDSAKSWYGAVGLMQVVPRIHGPRFARLGLSVYRTEDNIRIGGRILDEYLAKENGNLARALQRYNGNLADTRHRYAGKVAKEYLALAELAGHQPRLFIPGGPAPRSIGGS